MAFAGVDRMWPPFILFFVVLFVCWNRWFKGLLSSYGVLFMVLWPKGKDFLLQSCLCVYLPVSELLPQLPVAGYVK